MAGCRNATPHVVQRIEHVVSAGPKAHSEVTEVMLGVWCGKNGHCLGWPTTAPHSITITYAPHEVTIWSR